MISTRELDERFHRLLLRSLCCPVCLSPLFYSFVDPKKAFLFCESCTSTFLIADRLPILLLEDENWRQKADEIEGEFTYNTNIVSQNVHIERNAFVDKNTEIFLQACRLDFLNDDVLIAGCSMAELELFVKKFRNIVCLDIVPSLANACLNATRHREIPAAWVCGDGECLAFERESFDVVIVRQTLHHMLRYSSAICEFFRVCKRGGYVLIIDEPFSPPDLNDLLLLSLPDDFIVYRDVQLGQIRRKLKIYRQMVTEDLAQINMELLDGKHQYIDPTLEKPETFLADKYHFLSLLSCIFDILPHSNDFQLHWAREMAWTVDTVDGTKFYRRPNPNYEKKLLDRLVSPGNVSIAVRKTERTTVFRDRTAIEALPLDLAWNLASI